jgi:hypothetical protein
MVQPYIKKKKLSYHTLIILFMAFIALMLMTACQTTASKAKTGDNHDTALRQFVPNDGAEVHIASPANEAIFKSNDTVLVTIETVDFTIGEEGNHWHIYLDGNPIMVMGGYTFVLQNLPAGQHDIEVYLSNGHHEDLEQGDKVTILVEE